MNKKVFSTGSCVFCGAGKIFVSSSQKPFRYFKCRVCGGRFKTLEIVLSEFWLSGCITELMENGWFQEYPNRVRNAIFDLFKPYS
jgi:hypothetical protein